MGAIRTFPPVKLFVGLLVSDRSLTSIAREKLIEEYGPIDLESPVLPFRFTTYYESEMGASVERVFFSFERLIDAAGLAGVKRRTNAIEEEMKPAFELVRRPVNLDPGYLEHAKVVLASTKNFYHRIYLGGGIFAEITMHFKRNAFQFFPWTYPDYQSEEYLAFFTHMRSIYRSQLRTMCISNREDNS